MILVESLDTHNANQTFAISITSYPARMLRRFRNVLKIDVFQRRDSCRVADGVVRTGSLSIVGVNPNKTE